MTERQLTFVVWGALALAAVGCEAAVLLARGRLPRLDTLVGRVLARPTGRVVLVLGWMWLGWHAFAR